MIRLPRRNNLLSLIVLSLVTMVGCQSIINEELPSYEATSLVGVGDAAPDFELFKTDGVDAYLLILFSHTCPDCRHLMDALQERLDHNAEHPYIVAWSRGGTAEEIEQFADDCGYTFTLVADPMRQLYDKYATMYVPRCYVIDGDGVIRLVTYEYRDGDVELLFDCANNL